MDSKTQNGEMTDDKKWSVYKQADELNKQTKNKQVQGLKRKAINAEDKFRKMDV